MPVSKGKYFIAIIPPAPFFDYALELKHYINNHYQSKGALNSPPHITLHMPFEWRSDKEDELISAFQKHTTILPASTISLQGFGSFPPRVIFIHVVPSENLNRLQSSIRKFCKQELGLFNADYKDLPFHPHITVAFRDLRKAKFIEAWDEFKNKPFEGSFSAKKIDLLKHDGKKWNVLKEFSLNSI